MVTTAQLLYELSTDATCGENCIEWAVGRLLDGYDGDFLRRLAGLLAPYNHFEVKALVEQTLAEQVIEKLPAEVARRLYAKDLAARMAVEPNPLGTLVLLAKMALDGDHDADLMKFAMLDWAETDLREDDVQWYWEGATRENIVDLIRTYAAEYVATHP